MRTRQARLNLVTHHGRRRAFRFRPGLAVSMALVMPLLPMGAWAQDPPGLQPPGFDDFGQWETLSRAGDHGGLSPDGGWIAYGIDRTNGADELRFKRVGPGEPDVVAFGSDPVFSPDSRWLAYRIGYSEEEQEQLRDQDKPVQFKLGLRRLSTGESWVVEGVDSFEFSPDGAYLSMRRYPPEAPRGDSGGGRSPSGDGSPGTTYIVRELASGRDMSFGNVAQAEWQKMEGTHLLAMVISAEEKVGNGVHLFDAGSFELRVLESSASVYSNLTWREDAADLAVFRSMEGEGKEGATHMVLAWTGLGANEKARTFDPTSAPDFPAGMRTVPFRSLAWSEDGRRIFFGTAAWEDEVSAGGPGNGEGEADGATEDDPASVDIWHWTDVFVMPWQKLHVNQDRERNLLTAWQLDTGDFVQLGQDLVEERVAPIPGTDLALVSEWSEYAFERSIGRMGADIYLQDMTTGERSLVRENINDRYLQASPGGKYLLFMDQGHFWTVDLASRIVVNVTASAPVSFMDEASDQTSKVFPDDLQKPPFGVAGWTKDDASVLLYDEYDVWSVASDGSGARSLTEGAGQEVRHRLARPEMAGLGRGGFGGAPASPEDAWIDLDEPLYLSLYGEWTKKSGYGVLDPGGSVRRMVWLDKNVGSLARAEDADVYVYTVQAFDDSPDLFVGGPELRDAEQVTRTNPFQADFAWGHSELIDYVTDQGRKLQAALIYPAGYEPGKKYPMIVYNYELLSQNLHRYVVPSDRSYYNTAVFMSQGYLVLQPDIVFRIRQPGWSVVECVGAAVEKVIEMGIVDPEGIGMVGHSMGGFNTTFVATHTHGMFAAAVAGAPITDLVSYYGDHHWGSGIAETDHIETGQERMEVALYDDLQAYIDNSAVFGAHEMTVPLLLEAGDEDGIVAWHQSIELYNIARRAKRNVVMLTYAGEDHGLRKKENQRDYQSRILAWFGHYLKGEPPEPWITQGKSALEREAELKALKGREGGG